MTEWKIVGSTRKEGERKKLLAENISESGVIVRPKELRNSRKDEPGQYILQCDLKTEVGWKECNLVIDDYRLYELLLKVKWHPGPVLISRDVYRTGQFRQDTGDIKDIEYYISKPT